MLIHIIKKMCSFIFILILLTVIAVSIVYFSPDLSFKEMPFTKACYAIYTQFMSNYLTHLNITLSDVMLQIVLPTFEMVILAIILSIVVGFPLGVAVGLLDQGTTYHLIKLICLIFYASPIVWIAVLVMNVTSSDWLYVASKQYEPIMAHVSLPDIMLSFKDTPLIALKAQLKQIIVPVVILSIWPIVIMIDLVAQQVVISKNQNYIKAIRIRETSALKILWRYLLPNTIPKVVPQMTYNIAAVLFSAMVLEILLGKSGLGTWLLSAYYQQDYVIIAIVFFSCGALISLIALLSDVFIILFYPMQLRKHA